MGQLVRIAQGAKRMGLWVTVGNSPAMKLY